MHADNPESVLRGFADDLPSDIQTHDVHLWDAAAQAHVVKSKASTAVAPEALDHLVQWLRTTYKGGEVLITTSTAGSRSSLHETSAPVLKCVLDAVMNVIDGRKLVVADGPAFGPTYQADSVRLGYAELIKERGVRLLDLK